MPDPIIVIFLLLGVLVYAFVGFLKSQAESRKIIKKLLAGSIGCP